MTKTEILAPVGNYDMLYAGLAAGADSFYLSLDEFGARAYAENFTIENIKEVIDLIHLFGKRVFITMNTLIKDSEMAKAISYVEKLYQYGTDGLIIQDIGFFSIIKDKVPSMELHASTQMAVREYYGAKYLASLGFDRIVIARETPIEEIRKIAKLPCELEVFVHGSLCVSYSGECLMSSYFGGRSANRGRCAGPCRQKYQLISNGKTIGDDYFLNMKDLNAIDNIAQLLEIGVDCIKIEGRMKTAEYVYTAVSNYRSKIYEDNYNKNDLLDSSNRGYTDGFIFGQNRDYIVLKDDNKHRSVGKIASEKGKKYFVSNSNLNLGDNLEITTDKGKKLPFTTTKAYRAGEKIFLDKYKDGKINSHVLMLNSTSLNQDLEEGLTRYKNLDVKLHFEAKIDDYPKLTIVHGKHSATYTHNVKAEKASKISINEADIRENLSKFNDEIFEPSLIEVDIEDGIFLRKKDINQCRREAISLLCQEILKDYHRKAITIDLPEHKRKENNKAEKNIELLTNHISRELLNDFDNVYLRSFDRKYAGLNLYLNLDSHDDYDINELLSYIKENKIHGVILNNYRDLYFIDDFKNNDIKIRIGRYLNVFNSYAYDFYADFAESITSSVESDFVTINRQELQVEALAYGRIELMNMRHCPFSVIKKCGLKGCKTCSFNNASMKSFDGNEMKVIRYGSYSKIYPEEASIVDISKFTNQVSLLYSVMEDDDIKNTKKISQRYEKGVI